MLTIKEVIAAPAPDQKAIAVVDTGAVRDVKDEEGKVIGTEPILVKVPFWPELVSQYPAANVRELIFADAGLMARKAALVNLKVWHDSEDVKYGNLPDKAKQNMHKGRSNRIAEEIAEIDKADVNTSVLLG